MTKKPKGSKDPDILAVGKALRRAARRALELGLRTGTPVWVIKGGKIVDLTEESPKGSPQAILAALSRPSRCTADDVDALVDATKQGKHAAKS